MKTKKLTEKRVQKIIWDSLQKNSYMVMVPNFYGAFGWESDLIGLTKAGYIHEFEIKRSQEDLNNDRLKYKKTIRLMAAHRASSGFFLVPRQFYYVCSFWPSAKSIPSFAGVMYVKEETNELITIRRAPELPAKKANEKQITKMLTSLCHRFWRQRYG